MKSDVEEAIEQAVHQTIAELGLEAFRALSWFPSNGDGGTLAIEGVGSIEGIRD